MKNERWSATLGILLGMILGVTAAGATPPGGADQEHSTPGNMLAQRPYGRSDVREEKGGARKYTEEESRERQRQMEEEASGAAERMREERQEQERGRAPVEGEGAKGLEQQRERKAEQEQKELGKGSEQGQAAREQRKKWWRFWGE